MTEFFRKNHHIIELSIRETEEDVMGLSGKKKLLQLLKIASVTLGVYIIFKYMLPVILPFVLAYALCRFLHSTRRAYIKALSASCTIKFINRRNITVFTFNTMFRTNIHTCAAARTQ